MKSARPQDGARFDRALGFVPLGLAALIVVAVDTAANPKPTPSTREITPIDVSVQEIAHFDKARPDLRRFGKLEWRGGLVLKSPSEHFGGWSGLVIDADGRRFAAVSDAGSWMTGELVYKGNMLQGVRQARLGPLRSLAAGPLKRGRDRDAESATLAEGTMTNGTLLISFERNHRIGRFPITEKGIGAPAAYLKMPLEARRMKSNHGFEAVGILRAGPLKGSVVAISERFLDAHGHHSGWIWVKDEPQRFALRDPGEFDITEAAGLPDGGLLVLERRFRWLEGVKMRLRRITPAELRPGAVISGEVLLEADMGYEIDNMEGLALHRGARGETVVTLISDDNFNSFLQRTLMLQFALPEDVPASAKRTQ